MARLPTIPQLHGPDSAPRLLACPIAENREAPHHTIRIPMVPF